MRVLVTGATSGLGLATCAALRQRGASVWGTGRDFPRLQEVSARLGVEPVQVDHRDLHEVTDAVAGLPRFDAVVCNAGIQSIRGPSRTDAGIEETIAVNHLSHLALLDALRHRGDAPDVAVLIGSATHDPEQWTGTPPPDEAPIVQLAFDDAAQDSAKQGLTRYTTTKLMAVATAAALSREQPDTWFAAFDPGLMLDTRLGRQHPVVLRVLYRSLLRGVRVLPFASTSRASGQQLAELLLAHPPMPSGSYVDHRLRQQRPSTRALDRSYQDALLNGSRQIISDALRQVSP